MPPTGVELLTFGGILEKDLESLPRRSRPGPPGAGEGEGYQVIVPQRVLGAAGSSPDRRQ